jgi:hypothetical protein
MAEVLHILMRNRHYGESTFTSAAPFFRSGDYREANLYHNRPSRGLAVPCQAAAVNRGHRPGFQRGGRVHVDWFLWAGGDSLEGR